MRIVQFCFFLASIHFRVLTVDSDGRHCPVSALVTDPLITGLFSYPLNIYAPSLLRSTGNASMTFLNCTSIEVSRQDPLNSDKFHTCSTLKTCPVHRQNLIDASRRSKEWTHSNYLCKFTTHLREATNKVNIVVLGGSVTSGQFTEGYFCDGKLNKACKGVNALQQSGHTSWVHYWELWFKLQKMTHVKVHFLAVHGYSSAMMNEVIVDKLTAAGLGRLSNSDLVIIDHSFNDGLYLATIKVLPLQVGLEGLVRKLLELRDYQEFYTSVARHYSLPVWSLREAVNAPYAALNQSEYVEYIQHAEKVRYDLHPGWHWHLFQADLLASLLKRSSHMCSKKKRHYDLIPQLYQLPLPILQDSTVSCQREIRPLLDVSAEKVMKKEPIIGSWRVEPNFDHVWELRSEGRGRVGWIQEKSPSLAVYNGTSTLIFVPEDPSSSFGKNGDTPHLIQIQLMRTYLNAGQVKVYVCGNLMVNGDGMVKRADKLDALWGSYENYKLSLPEMEYIIFPDFGMSCKDKNDMNIRIEYVKDIQCREKSVRKHNRDPTDHECDKEMAVRTGRQKFKLISVKICQLQK